jgi:hypothetical protein
VGLSPLVLVKRPLVASALAFWLASALLILKQVPCFDSTSRFLYVIDSIQPRLRRAFNNLLFLVFFRELGESSASSGAKPLKG